MKPPTTYALNDNKSHIQRPKHQPKLEILQAALNNLIPFLFSIGAPRGVSDTFDI